MIRTSYDPSKDEYEQLRRRHTIARNCGRNTLGMPRRCRKGFIFRPKNRVSVTALFLLAICFSSSVQAANNYYYSSSNDDTSGDDQYSKSNDDTYTAAAADDQYAAAAATDDASGDDYYNANDDQSSSGGGDDAYVKEQEMYQKSDDDLFHWNANVGFDGVSVMPLSCINL